MANQPLYDPRLDPQALLSPSETAALLGCSARKLEKDRRSGKGLPFIRLSTNRVRYVRQDILDHAAALRVVPGETRSK
jgi:hypothetical protein